MRNFYSLDKTKYIVALALLLTLTVFILPIHAGETFANPLNQFFGVKSNVNFDYADIRTAFISPAKMEFFGRNECIKKLKQRYNAVWQEKILPVSKFVLEDKINKIYETVRIPYYMEICKLLVQLIIIYIFLTDGKKRMMNYHAIE